MNNSALEMFILRRLAELDAAEKPLREKLNIISAEKEKLKKALEAVGTTVRVKDEADEITPPRPPQRLRGMTLQDAVLDILRGHHVGLPAADILKQINARHNTTFARESLSPQISRLKQAGRVEQHGRIWKLKNQYPTENSNEEGKSI